MAAPHYLRPWLVLLSLAGLCEVREPAPSPGHSVSQLPEIPHSKALGLCLDKELSALPAPSPLLYLPGPVCTH